MNKVDTVPIGYSDLGYCSRAAYSDLNPHERGQSLYQMITVLEKPSYALIQWVDDMSARFVKTVIYEPCRPCKMAMYLIF